MRLQHASGISSSFEAYIDTYLTLRSLVRSLHYRAPGMLYLAAAAPEREQSSYSVNPMVLFAEIWLVLAFALRFVIPLPLLSTSAAATLSCRESVKGTESDRRERCRGSKPEACEDLLGCLAILYAANDLRSAENIDASPSPINAPRADTTTVHSPSDTVTSASISGPVSTLDNGVKFRGVPFGDSRPSISRSFFQTRWATEWSAAATINTDAPSVSRFPPFAAPTNTHDTSPSSPPASTKMTGVPSTSHSGMAEQPVHSGPSGTVVLALSLSLGISTFAAGIILCLQLRKRRARPMIADVNPFVDTHNSSQREGATARASLDTRDSRATLCPQMPCAKDVSADDDGHAQSNGSLAREGSAVAQVGSILADRDGRAQPVADYPETGLRTPAGVGPGAELKPSRRPRRSTDTRELPPPEDRDTILLRLPVAVAQRVMATMTSVSAPGIRSRGESEDGQHSEILPAYEPRAPALVGTGTSL
ncbi:hypothetical protein C8Q77DRAFT_707608 [Trametes polyzona]|nr:hypothetical protein C8Q77DRAFT_707608 [Trametes polyzona]